MEKTTIQVEWGRDHRGRLLGFAYITVTTPGNSLTFTLDEGVDQAIEIDDLSAIPKPGVEEWHNPQLS